MVGVSLGAEYRGIRLLANTSDAGYQQKNRDAALAELVYTYISLRESAVKSAKVCEKL